MSKEIAKYTFHVASDKRSSGTATDLNLALANTIALKSKRGHFEFLVHSVNIPFSYYQLSTDISTLTVTFVNVGTKTTTISLTPGNYTVLTVLTELSTKLITAAQSSVGAYVGYTPVFTFTYSNTTSKSTLSMTGPVGSTITLGFSTNTNLGVFFGFSLSTTFSPVLAVTGANVAVANPVNYLLIRTGNLQQIYNREYIVETDTFSDIVYRIPVGTQQNTWIQHHADGNQIQISNNLISIINIYITTNLTYTPVDLQGINWAISFSIIEIEPAEYESLFSTTLASIQNTQVETPIETPNPNTDAPVESQEEIDLRKQYQDELDKLEVYKNKLLKIKKNKK